MSRAKIYIQYLATLLLLVYVFYSTGLFNQSGREELLTTFLAADIRYLIAAFLFTIALVYVSAIKWYFLSKSIGLTSSLNQLFCFYMIGRYFNLVLPSSIGGDISRIYLQGKSEGNRAASAATVFIDRITGLFALIVLALLVTMFYSKVSESKWVTIAMLVSVFVFFVALWVVISKKMLNWLTKLGTKIAPKSNLIFSKIHSFRDQVLLYRNGYKSLLTAVFWSFVFYLFAIINVWLCVVAFDSSTSLVSIALAVPIIMIIMNMPISIGNFGILEFSHVVVLGMFGIASSVVLSAVLLIRLKSLFAALLGWLFSLASHIEPPIENSAFNKITK